MTRTRNLLAAAAFTLVTAGTVAACTQDDQQLDDAPLGQMDDSPQKVLTNLDQFPNVAIRCYFPEGAVAPIGIYTTTREASSAAMRLVVNDPTCEGYNPEVATVVSGG